MSLRNSEGKGVLLVGGGFLGKYFIQEWLRESYNWIIVLDKIESSAFFSHPQMRNYEKDERLVYQWGNSGDPEQLDKFLKNNEIDYVVYTAAIADVPYARDNPKETHRINVENTGALLEYLGKNGFKGKIVMTSSESVYKSKECLPVEKFPTESIAFRETDPIDGHSVYGKSKVAQEHISWEMAKKYDLNLTVIRSATMYGMYARPKQVVPTFIRQILQKQQVTMFGDGKQTSRDLIYVQDTANAIKSILATPDEVTKGETFNIGSGGERFLLNLCNGLKTILNQPCEAFDPRSGTPNPEYVPIKFLPFLEGEKGARMVLNTDKAKSKLKMKDMNGQEVSWEPNMEIMDGLRATIFWMVHDMGYDESQIKEMHQALYPEKYKGRTEQNPQGQRV